MPEQRPPPRLRKDRRRALVVKKDGRAFLRSRKSARAWKGLLHPVSDEQIERSSATSHRHLPELRSRSPLALHRRTGVQHAPRRRSVASCGSPRPIAVQDVNDFAEELGTDAPRIRPAVSGRLHCSGVVPPHRERVLRVVHTTPGAALRRSRSAGRKSGSAGTNTTSFVARRHRPFHWSPVPAWPPGRCRGSAPRARRWRPSFAIADNLLRVRYSRPAPAGCRTADRPGSTASVPETSRPLNRSHR